MFKSISSWVKTVLNVKQLFIIGMTGCITITTDLLTQRYFNYYYSFFLFRF